MSDARWQRLEALFDTAQGLPVAHRAAFLARECGDDPALRDEVLSLLAADASGHTLLDGNALDAAPALAAPVHPGQQIGPYRIVATLGEGGMGIVYLAERCDGQFEQRVALKIARLGLLSPEHVRRFQAERQILARLEHPGIARLLDGGVTEQGLPWFSLEYVEGLPIDQWCARHEVDVTRRLELFLAVCDAVQYAQNNLVVHRDLKPSNILVTADGTVKLLDFGIAKLVADDDGVERTRTAMPMMTASYAAPEQVRGESITTATDVYALGLVLYELLAGVRPYDVRERTPAELERVICTTEPARPSRATTDPRRRRQLVGDLDNICLKAIAKEPDRRYSTAGQFGEDIRQHLAGLPVHARPATFAYLARKAMRRYRTPLVAGALVIVAAIGLAGYATNGVARARDRAQREAARTQQVTEFLTSIFEVADPDESRGADTTARELLARGTQRVRRELAGQPDLQATMQNTLGRVSMNLGLYAEADSLLTAAVATEEARGATGDGHFAQMVYDLGQLRQGQGRYAEADSLLRVALKIQRRQRGPDDGHIASTLVALGHAERALGRFDAAESDYREALAVIEAATPPDETRRAVALGALALLMTERDRFAEAEPLYRESLAILRRTVGEDHPEVATTLFNLGLLLGDRGDLEGAEQVQRETLALDRKLYGDHHPNVAYDLTNVAFLLREKGSYAEAESTARKALAMRTEILGPDHPETLLSRANLSQILEARGEYVEAARIGREVLARETALLGPDSPSLCARWNQLGWYAYDLGHYARADSFHRRALAVGTASFDPDHKSMAISGLQLARDLVAEHRLAEADSIQQTALATARRLYRYDNPFTAANLAGLAHIRLEAGRLADAERLAAQSLAMVRGSVTPALPRVASGLELLGEIAAARHDAARADSLLAAALHEQRRFVGLAHPEAAWYAVQLGAVKLERGESAAAAALVAPAAAALQAALPATHWKVAYAKGVLAACRLANGDTGARSEIRAASARVATVLGDGTRMPTSLARFADRGQGP